MDDFNGFTQNEFRHHNQKNSDYRGEINQRNLQKIKIRDVGAGGIGGFDRRLVGSPPTGREQRRESAKETNPPILRSDSGISMPTLSGSSWRREASSSSRLSPIPPPPSFRRRGDRVAAEGDVMPPPSVSAAAGGSGGRTEGGIEDEGKGRRLQKRRTSP